MSTDPTELAAIAQQASEFLFWFNRDGSPCDGPRFREEEGKLRKMLTAAHVVSELDKAWLAVKEMKGDRRGE